MKTRIGCLGLLAVWALIGVYKQYTDGFGEDGGGRFALMGLFGVAVVVVGSVVESLTAKRGSAPRGFPIEPKRPDREQ